jgi:hypothetical protein
MRRARRRGRALVVGAALVLVIGGCASILGIPSDVEREGSSSGGPDVLPGDQTPEPEDGSTNDVQFEIVLPDGAPPLSCDPSKPYQPPVRLEPPSTGGALEGSPRLSESELTMYFDGIRADAGPHYTLFTATRPTLNSPFGPTTKVGALIDKPDAHEYSPNISSDGLTLVFERQNVGSTASEILVATRTGPSGAFNAGVVQNITPTTGYEANPFIRGNPTEIWFVATGADTTIDVFLAKQAGNQYNATPVKEINSDAGDYAPVISYDGRTIFFASDRPGGQGGLDIWSATRAQTSLPFGAPTIVPNVNTKDNDTPGWVSADGCRLYIAREAIGTQDIWVATRPK